MDTNHWKEFSEANALLYLAQLLNEMLFDFTLDTYKPNALNVHSLIHEAIDLSGRIREGAVKEGNFSYVRDELEISLKKDLTLKKLLEAKHGHYVTQIKNAKSHEELHIVLESLHYYLSNKKYYHALQSQLKEEVRSGKSKSNIFSVSRALITEILEYGYEKSFIYSVVNSTFFNPKKEVNTIDVLDEFLSNFNFEQNEYKVTFKCSPGYKKLKGLLKSYDLKVVNKCPKLPNIPATKQFLSNSENGSVFIISDKVKALDHAAARNKSERKLTFVSDLYSFYNHQLQLKIESNAYVREIKNGYCLNINRQADAVKKGMDHAPSEIEGIINSLRENMSLNGKSIYLFTKAIQLHRLAINAKELENQLLDLWAALETLIPFQPNSNKKRIQLIVDYLAPVLSVNYLSKLLNELHKDITLWNEGFYKSILNKVNLDVEPVEKLTLIISTEKYLKLFQELDAKLDEFPLLKNRVGTYRIWSSDTNELQSLLERHYKKVSWQIRRIYRARNSIIHNGEKPHQLEILVENLHNYVDSCIKGISDLVIDKKGESVSQFFIETQITYSEHIDALRTNGNRPIELDNYNKLILGIIK